MNIKKYTSSLLEIIRYSNKDPELELEARLKYSSLNPLTSEILFNVMKRLKGMNDVNLIEETTILDIGFADDYKEYRVSVHGDDYITQYCQTNDIKLIDPNMVTYLYKTPVRFVDMNEYNIRFNLKREKELMRNESNINTLITNWTTFKKVFRYKKRFSFKTSDGLFRFDLTIVKSSLKKLVKMDNKFVKKKHIKPFMVKYLVKPDFVKDVNEWFSKHTPETELELRGKMVEELQYFRTLQKSNVLKNDMEYEIEIEYLGNKIIKKSNIQDDTNLLKKFMGHIICIIQAIQKSYYIINTDERNLVIDEYKKLMGDYKFNGPMNVSITQRHIIEKKYNEYSNSISIRKGYSVTDKADGERNLLVILENGEMYLINRKNQVRKLGARCVSLKSSIFDSEYLMKDKYGKNVNMLLLFDVYFVNGEDVRGRILNRNMEEIQKDIIEQSRYEIMNEKRDAFRNNLEISKGNNLDIIVKNFYFGDDDTIDEETIAQINTLESYIDTLDPLSHEYKENTQSLSVIKADTFIFKQASKVYNKDYPYHIDGLVFTPRSLPVGSEPEREKRNMFNGRWYRCLKWKPPEENTIDFMCIYNMDENNKYETKYITKNGIVSCCRIIMLYVGYNPLVHTKHNSFRVLNENLTYSNGYNPTLFTPIDPYVKDVHLCYLPIKNNSCYAEDTNIIGNNSIVEFSYISDEEKGFCWKPLRIRDTLKPNDFVTANNVWNSIFNPVTLEMITTGVMSTESNVYFDNLQKRSDKRSKSMNDFHSFIKKKYLKDNLLNKKTLLDIGVGKAGDLNHWLDSGCSMVVGIDKIKDNLDNSHDGACNRLLSRYSSIHKTNKTNKKNNHLGIQTLLENTLMIWADCSKNILDGTAANDELNKHYLDVIYGNILKMETTNTKLTNFYNMGGKFDLVVSNFSIHYFFESESILRNVLRNISESLTKGGRFICTTMDGTKLFNILEINRVYHSADLSWKIENKFKQDSFPKSANSLGLKVGVYIDSIGQTLDEYLVHPEYFEELCNEFNLYLIEKKSFQEIFNTVQANKVVYGDMLNLDETYKPYSFLNINMVFEKRQAD